MSGQPDAIEDRLEAWGAAERSRLIEPGDRFMQAVQDARPASVVSRRWVAILAAAAAVALAAVVSIRALPGSRGPEEGVYEPQVAKVPMPRVMTAGMGRGLDATSVLEMGDAPAPGEMPVGAPTRASDAYCAGCLEEMMRI